MVICVTNGVELGHRIRDIISVIIRDSLAPYESF
jgi:hypothetical protein